ncbi:MAG: protoporphyrinogen oxidase [Acidobacteriota bacterium]
MHEVIVVGAGISGLAYAHAAMRRGVEDVVVLEASGRAGGKIQTEWSDSWCCEWGPHGFLDNVPETLDLAAELGLTAELVRADEGAGDRFIARRGKLRKVPLKPPAFLASDIISLPGKLRVLLEPFGGRGAEEESVAEFAIRRIGREAAEVLVDAMVTGVYAGDPARLSLPATFPKMRAMEYAHGSLVRAMLARRREGRAGGPAGPGGTLTTFRRGMQQLTDALATTLAGKLRLDCEVAGIDLAAPGYVVRLARGDELAGRRLVIALPPHAATRLLAGVFSGEACAALAAIPTVPVAVVVTGYRQPMPFATATRGFGFLVPGRELREILGTIFCDSTFPVQAPAGTTLLRTLLGGARNGALVERSDEELLATVRTELSHHLGGDPAPDFVRIIRHREAISQYTFGHLDRLRVIDAEAGRHPGLLLLGSGYRGIAVNSCIAEARKAAAIVVSPSS